MEQIKCFEIILEGIKSLKQTEYFRSNLEDTKTTETNKVSQNYMRHKIIQHIQNTSELTWGIQKTLKQIKWLRIISENKQIIETNKLLLY